MSRIYYLIRLNRFVRNHRLKFAALLLADWLKMRRFVLRLDPIMACNFRCTMCHFSDSDFVHNNKGTLTDADIQAIAEKLFPYALHLTIGCMAEPTLYKNYTSIIKTAKFYGIPSVSLVSNASRITRQDIDDMICFGLDELIVSLHGVTRETYNAFMPGGSYETLHETLKLLDARKKVYGSTLPRLRINYTVNPDNLNELKNFFECFGQYHIATLQIRPIMNLGNTVYQKKDLSPHIEEYHEIIRTLRIACRLRRIMLLAPKQPVYSEQNPYSVIMDVFSMYLCPKTPQVDFRWHNESFAEYLKRIGWRNQIWHGIFSPLDKLKKFPTHLAYEISV